MVNAAVSNVVIYFVIQVPSPVIIKLNNDTVCSLFASRRVRGSNGFNPAAHTDTVN